MSTRRWAGAGFGLLMGCFAVAGGCGGDDSAPGDNGDGGIKSDSPSTCSTVVVVKDCNHVAQNGVEFELGCSSIVNSPVNGKPVCALSGQCNNGCLDPMNVNSCLKNCRPGGGADGGASPLGTSCASNTDCGGGLTCLKSSDNIIPSAGPPNGICTAECSVPANQDLCKSLNGICVSFSTSGTKSYCLDSCTTGKVTPPEAKCHGRLDTVCAALDSPGLFACVPLCATDADCGSRKCDLGTGFCTDVVTPGAPIGSPCSLDSECAGAICYPFVVSDAASSPGVCSALCRLGNSEGCAFRTSALDAGPPVGGCLLGPGSATNGDIGICAQLCDTVTDCTTQDSRWNCLLDADVRTGFGHAGYCWLGNRPDAGAPRDAAAEAAAETGAPETGAPEASPPEPSPDAPAESGSDAADTDGNSNDVAPPDSASD